MQRHQRSQLFLFAFFFATWLTAVGGLSPVQAQSQAGDAAAWEGMHALHHRDYDWLRPPDSALQKAVTLTAEGELDSVTLYTFQCGESLGCQKRFRFKKKRTVARITFATPIRLAAEEVRRAAGRQGAPPNPEEMHEYRNTFAVSLLLQAKKRGDKPDIVVQAGGNELRPAQTRVSGRRIERCWVKSGDRCWRTLQVASFAVEEGVALSGAGEIVVRWDEDEFSVPINFDYLW
jgi:hypothetical protein